MASMPIDVWEIPKKDPNLPQLVQQNIEYI